MTAAFLEDRQEVGCLRRAGGSEQSILRERRGGALLGYVMHLGCAQLVEAAIQVVIGPDSLWDRRPTSAAAHLC